METKNDLSHKDFLKLDKDYIKAAKAASLIYVSDKQAGIERIQKGKEFIYQYKGKEITDAEELLRIKKLVIPPAWTNVWICPKENGHIQVTGYDVRGRKQYRYHPQWNALRSETKFHHLYEFGKLLPAMRLKLEEDMSRKDLSEEKVLATVVSLMERTSIRIGSNDYEKLYGSYGLTTLKDKHVKVSGNTVNFVFKGKKGVDHKVTLQSRRLARMVQKCRDIPGKELFQYFDADGNRKPIDSGMVNRYIKQLMGDDFSAKDFRTWAGSLHILLAFKKMGDAASDSECKKNIVAALDEVSKKLGNTRTVCKKYYVHPGIIKLYEEQNLSKYLQELDKIEEPDKTADHTTAEKVLMSILKELV